MTDAISKAIGALEYAATMLDEDRYPGRITEAIAALQAMQGEAAPQPAVPDGLHQMIVDYIRDDFETLQDGGDWCVITPEEVEEQLKYLRKHDLLIQHPTDPERVMVALLSAAKEPI
jgi:hypothetical protein